MWYLLLYAGTSDDFYGYLKIRSSIYVIDALKTTFPMGSMMEHQKIFDDEVIDQLKRVNVVYTVSSWLFYPDGNLILMLLFELYNQEKTMSRFCG
jgi:hypothetical protein